jgi:hypothetical protein
MIVFAAHIISLPEEATMVTLLRCTPTSVARTKPADLPVV